MITKSLRYFPERKQLLSSIHITHYTVLTGELSARNTIAGNQQLLYLYKY